MSDEIDPYKNKTTSLENYLKDENIDRAMGITPTHPGHTVDTASRWSGQGKGDSLRPVKDREAFEAKMHGIFGDKRIRKDVIRSTRGKDGTWIHTVSTPDRGIVKMTSEEHDEYEARS